MEQAKGISEILFDEPDERITRQGGTIQRLQTLAETLSRKSVFQNNAIFPVHAAAEWEGRYATMMAPAAIAEQDREISGIKSNSARRSSGAKICGYGRIA
ncbi:MAG: hypothetical protein LBU24_05510 [Methanocalculaceae archaeon]|nr:hypothetical protein [Methanocalculaceae archaeon]